MSFWTKLSSLELGCRVEFNNDEEKHRLMQWAEIISHRQHNADGILTSGFGGPKGFIQLCLKNTV